MDPGGSASSSSAAAPPTSSSSSFRPGQSASSNARHRMDTPASVPRVFRPPGSEKNLLALPPPEGFPGGGSSSSSAARGQSQQPTRENRHLNTSEVEALRMDDFLLGRSEHGAEAYIWKDPSACQRLDQTFAELDVALKCQDLASAEAIWKRMTKWAKEGAVAVLKDRPELRTIASRYVVAMTPQVLEDLESAIDRGDRHAASQQHQRLENLRLAWLNSGAGNGADGALSDIVPGERSRKATLEARYQQLVHKRGPLMCALLPDIWCPPIFCWKGEGRWTLTDLCSGEAPWSQSALKQQLNDRPAAVVQ